MIGKLAAALMSAAALAAAVTHVPPAPPEPGAPKRAGAHKGLTAVDGATVINDRHELLAFGAKITRAGASRPIEEVLLSEPVTDRQPLLMHPSRLGGTRHLSAAQFVFDQRDAQALVASQDGYFTVFSWSPESQIVMAHRIDVLLI